jgi:cellulose synthase/poly-beta-1,6-N-acetylglucosamine synthase-like glycosyltransferase
MLIIGPYLVETALWVIATLVITVWATRGYLNAFFSIGLGRVKKKGRAAVALAKRNPKPPFVTVLLPTFNEYAVVDRLLESVTGLDYPAYEIIVADDSTDGRTMARLAEWERRGKVKVAHRNSRSGFKAGALNRALGLSRRKGGYVLFFDADYVPPPDIIWKMLADFSDGTADAVQGYPDPSLNSSKSVLTRSVRVSSSYYCLVDIATRQRMRGFIPIFGSVFMIKRGVLEAVGGFDESSITEDWALASRLAEEGYNVVFDEGISVPAECPTTLRSVMKQQMRWAEGITRDTKNHLLRMLRSKKATPMKKFDYLFYGFSQFNSIFGTISYFVVALAIVINAGLLAGLPYDRALILGGLGPFGQYALFVAPVYLPLAFIIGALVAMHREGRIADFPWCFTALSMSLFLGPFVAFSSIKGLLTNKGSWSRTPKTGEVT